MHVLKQALLSCMAFAKDVRPVSDDPRRGATCGAFYWSRLISGHLGVDGKQR